MRLFIKAAALVMVVGIALCAWLIARKPNPAEVPRIVAALESDAPIDEPVAYAHCASCHLHDGSGRPDGSIPRLAGQRRAVIEAKLNKLRAGIVPLPVMQAFARTLEVDEVSQIASYLSSLPATWGAKSRAPADRGRSLYATHCASCHGVNGEGNDSQLTPRLCGQYAGYLERRLDEMTTRHRGDADAIMNAVLLTVSSLDLGAIVTFLANGEGCPIEPSAEGVAP